ncbi:unnamed protein product [Peronospora farinosa]|uniref:Guided entry of tail-anchored proteins 1 n=1 Tax=Peronospora farinosa TaxID=134698 RepID=A0AAV0T7R2_9STRA|nr:unnamed protein product [Peronospora farinosa]CAI5714944.1 unnamed protein product [Peronospora farinosa]
MVNMPTIIALKVYDVLFIAIIMFIIDLVIKLWNERGTQLSPIEQELMNEYNTQVRLVKRLNAVETFVEQAKATRKMNALQREIQELKVKRMAANAPSAFQKQFNRIRTPVMMGLTMLYYWNEPLVVLPQGYMLPVERLLSIPAFPLGSVSAMGWAGICRRVNGKILG